MSNVDELAPTPEHCTETKIWPTPALADGDRVRQVLSNLMSNARKFSDAGDTIHVKLDREDDVIVLRVEDHGKGIPPDLLDKVFDAFYQVEPAATRSAGGLGSASISSATCVS